MPASTDHAMRMIRKKKALKFEGGRSDLITKLTGHIKCGSIDHQDKATGCAGVSTFILLD
jgi:hypothetical protein